MKAAITLLLACSAAQAADLAIPTVQQINPEPNCLNDGTTVIAVGSTDGTYLYGTASYTNWVCRLKVHAGRGPGIRIFSGCAEAVWSAATGEVVSLTYQGTSCPQ